jgi:hypothetical protein
LLIKEVHTKLSNEDHHQWTVRYYTTGLIKGILFSPVLQQNQAGLALKENWYNVKGANSYQQQFTLNCSFRPMTCSPKPANIEVGSITLLYLLYSQYVYYCRNTSEPNAILKRHYSENSCMG